ncbi:unnamed protein product [Diamesa hyperborea]
MPKSIDITIIVVISLRSHNIWERLEDQLDRHVDSVKSTMVTNPGLVADIPKFIGYNVVAHSVIVHFNIRLPQLSYAGNPRSTGTI